MVNVPSYEELAAVERESAEHDTAQDTELAALAQRVGTLEARPVSSGAAAPWVGAYVGELNNPSPDYLALWRARQREWGPVPVRRCYDSSIKAPDKGAWLKVPGAVPAYSLKPPNGDTSGFISGQYVTAYQALVQALPYGSFLAVYHEPEDNLTGETFAALTARAYDDAKMVRPDLTFMYAAMAYQWEIGAQGQGNTATTDGWLDAAKLVDLVTVDVYASQADFKPMSQDAGFARWMTDIVAASGTPWGVTERGISDHAGDTARADILAEDWAYACRYGAQLFLYYDADWSGGNWLLDRPLELGVMGRIAAQGRVR
jgi:hypothetical protein